MKVGYVGLKGLFSGFKGRICWLKRDSFQVIKVGYVGLKGLFSGYEGRICWL